MDWMDAARQRQDGRWPGVVQAECQWLPENRPASRQRGPHAVREGMVGDFNQRRAKKRCYSAAACSRRGAVGGPGACPRGRPRWKTWPKQAVVPLSIVRAGGGSSVCHN